MLILPEEARNLRLFGMWAHSRNSVVVVREAGLILRVDGLVRCLGG